MSTAIDATGLSPFDGVSSPSTMNGGRVPPSSGMQVDWRTHRRRHGAPTVREWTVLLFSVTFVAYAALGIWLQVQYQLIAPDGWSRVANAGYVLYSRDPHLAAVGFVWNPLPSFVDMGFLLFVHFVPQLLTQGIAGTLMSAGFMAGAVVQIRGIALDRGVPIAGRWIVVLFFTLDPMLVLYGGNGMSESPFLFFMIWATRRLLAWMQTDRVSDLVAGGVALAGGYLTRYEAAAAALAVMIAVFGITTLQSRSKRWLVRIKRGLLDAAVVAFPFAVVFAGWALAGWITSGSAFAQFSSQYGNSSQVSVAAGGIASFQQSAGGPLELVVRDMLHFEPALPVAIVVAVIFAARRIELDSVLPVATFGGVLAFETYTQLTGQVFPWFRFFIMSIPLTSVLVVLFWPRAGGVRRMRRRSRIGVFALAFLVIAPGIPSTWTSMLNPSIDPAAEEYGLREVIHPAEYPVVPWTDANDATVAIYLDQLDLPNGSVLMDSFLGWGIWLASNDHEQFVITSDYDFVQHLNSPWQSGIRYLVVAQPSGSGSEDAINRRYPTLYNTGDGFATLVLSVPAPAGGTNWHIYKVDPPTGATGA